MKLADSKEVFKFMVDEEEVTFSPDELKTMLKLPQATANNNAEFVEPRELSVMIEFLNIIGHIVRIRLAWKFYTKDLPQPWQTLRKILMRCLTTRIRGIDQQRVNELHHYVNNDKFVQLIFNSKKIKGRGMGIREWLLTPEIMQTKAYKLYADNFKIAVLMNQSQSTESSQGTNKTLSAPRSSNPQEHQSGESSALKKPIIIRIPKRKHPDPETPILTAEQINLANLIKAQLLNLLDEDVNKLVKGEESDANQFSDDMMLIQEDPNPRIDPESYKESLEVEKIVDYVSVDEEEEEETFEAQLIKRKWKGSLEIRDTPLATPTTSPRNESLYLDKDKLKELTAYKPSSSLSQPNSDHLRHLQGDIVRMSRHHGYMLQHMRKTFMPRHDMKNLVKKLEETLKEVEREKSKAEILSMVVDDFKKEQERTRIALYYQVSNDIDTNVPPQVDPFLRNYMNNNILHVYPSSSSSSIIHDLQQQLTNAFSKKDHEDHHDNDARPEGKSSAKRQRTFEKK
ncbi:hypothetical protein Tco_0052494 [Tanacetum coccineum]